MHKKQIKEFILYGIVGVLTTFINYFIYFVLLRYQTSWLIANSIAWLGAVIFAFYANKMYVFQSNNDAKQEALLFFTMRVFTLLIENLLLAIFIQWLAFSALIAKVIVSFVVVIANYGFCKSKVFKKKEGIYYEQN